MLVEDEHSLKYGPRKNQWRREKAANVIKPFKWRAGVKAQPDLRKLLSREFT